MMSASEQMRAMLDQLMGTARNGPSQEDVKFSDSKVCKSFLLESCPHEILASTRMDLGECPKIHSIALRADYERESEHKDFFYDVDAYEHLKAFIDDCDRRTELAKKRLAETQEELSAEVNSKAENVHQLAEEIGKKLADAEQAGADGKVEESMKLLEEVEEIRKKKEAAELEYRNSMPASSYQQQKLRVCEVCSAYLGIHDNDRRLADHFGGKLHIGFIKIREKLAALETNYKARKEARREKRLHDEGRDVKSESRSRSRRDRSVSRSQRDRSRERRDRDRNRDRDRYRDRRRDDERRRRRSRSRSRGHSRSRHRSRSRSRRERRSRSRSRDRRRSSKKRSERRHRGRSGSYNSRGDRSDSRD